VMYFLIPITLPFSVTLQWRQHNNPDDYIISATHTIRTRKLTIKHDCSVCFSRHTHTFINCSITSKYISTAHN
jgi:hypothetical protein